MPRVVHFEIHAEEPDRAIGFYRAVFGWEFNKWKGPQDYWLIETGPEDQPGINGGMIRRKGALEGEAIIAYVCNIDVPSVDETLKKVLDAGGKVVVPKMPIPGVGWLAYGKDTEGNLFGLVESDPKAK